ncbi:hypothetical protein GcLGCM259_2456 [Glutamicibacter creatinolyticus]|uniref:Uncharacterized protein n=1 Tax=Glutamicibacter creatinolyticus TaxID=162496 RepID=A0A5B7WYC1_9MICC|nr:hypothetical protein GcLGCM259_2456 [Glutamicibacter creatinolyticus]
MQFVLEPQERLTQLVFGKWRQGIVDQAHGCVCESAIDAAVVVSTHYSPRHVRNFFSQIQATKRFTVHHHLVAGGIEGNYRCIRPSRGQVLAAIGSQHRFIPSGSAYPAAGVGGSCLNAVNDFLPGLRILELKVRVSGHRTGGKMQVTIIDAGQDCPTLCIDDPRRSIGQLQQFVTTGGGDSAIAHRNRARPSGHLRSVCPRVKTELRYNSSVHDQLCRHAVASLVILANEM